MTGNPDATDDAILLTDGVFWKTCPEHWSFTLRLLFGRFILNHVPMLDKDSVLNAQNIRGNPIHRSTEAAKSPGHDHEVSLSHDRSGLVLPALATGTSNRSPTIPGVDCVTTWGIAGRDRKPQNASDHFSSPR